MARATSPDALASSTEDWKSSVRPVSTIHVLTLDACELADRDTEAEARGTEALALRLRSGSPRACG
jgi:hypothetical protein